MRPHPTPILHVSSVIPWDTMPVELDVPTGYWGFNPSIALTPDGKWLCTVRCANYHLDESAGTSATKIAQADDPAVIKAGIEPGTVIPVGRVMPSVVYNRNMMVTLDPKTLKTITMSEMLEHDGEPRIPVFIRGFDDLRLTWTAQDGLCAIGNAAHFSEKEPREICALIISHKTHHIIGAKPLRGPWSELSQKNWSPFHNTGQLRLLYSVERGGIHTRSGRILEPRDRSDESEPTMMAGGRPSVFAGGERITLRGGTQLVRIAPYPGRWLSLAHGVSDAAELGLQYWHCWYTTDDNGTLLERSQPMKLSSARIEFAAGLALEPETGRLVVSYGMGDDRAMLGVTRLDSVLRLLRPIGTHVDRPSRAPKARTPTPPRTHGGPRGVRR